MEIAKTPVGNVLVCYTGDPPKAQYLQEDPKGNFGMNGRRYKEISLRELRKIREDIRGLTKKGSPNRKLLHQYADGRTYHATKGWRY